MKKAGILLLFTCLIAAVICMPTFGEWFESINISGVLEAEAGYEKIDPAEGDEETSSDIALATMELGIDAELNEYVSGHVLFLWEEDDTEPIDLDEGIITISGGGDSAAYFSVGKMYIPFGNFESNMISDPLPLEIAETRESAVLVGFERNGLYGALFIFNGDVDEDGEESQIDNFGATVCYEMENDDFALNAGIGYINNIIDSDGLTDAFDEERDALADISEDAFIELKDYVGGINAYAALGLGPFSLLGEYISALDDPEFNQFDGTLETVEKMDAFKAWSIEAGYAFTMGEKEAVAALSYQGTDNLEDILPESRILGSLGVAIFENTSLALEYAHDEYENDDEADIVTMQLAIEF